MCWSWGGLVLSSWSREEEQQIAAKEHERKPEERKKKKKKWFIMKWVGGCWILSCSDSLHQHQHKHHKSHQRGADSPLLARGRKHSLHHFFLCTFLLISLQRICPNNKQANYENRDNTCCRAVIKHNETAHRQSAVTEKQCTFITHYAAMKSA